MSRLIKELIEIPERVHKGDFVLKLNEVVTDGTGSQQAVAQYVVTKQLLRCFDQALGIVKAAVEENASKGTYLHGSFGSGKSHFMAILYLMLTGKPEVLGKPELAPVVQSHAWIKDKKILLVPYHMIGAESLEQAIFKQYVDHVRKLHPNAPLPAVYLDEGLLDNADMTRANVGDATFFAKLSAVASGGGGGEGWGSLASPWDAGSYEVARHADPGDGERARLVTDLLKSWFTSFGDLAAHGDGFVALDDGLSALSRHAQMLGYDALVLFLDELVLWLASRAGDTAFLSREGPKVAKLVEAQSADRPVPLVSFIARQQDLRKLVGDHVPGAEKLGFTDSLNWWEGRFDEVKLEDRNLPVIAEKRILMPKGEGARAELDAAFQKAIRVKQATLETLLTSDADRELFRKVYPFSPALVQALVAVSGALQRERTALKVMVHLLSRQRDELRVGDIVPVGDLWDVIAEGDEPFSDVMRAHFDKAKALWETKLQPLLEREHGVTADAIEDGSADRALALKFRNDGRLLKTLLLAALVPGVEAFKGLTASRLAALNHGTMTSPIPGREAQDALSKVRRWASDVGEIRIGDEGANPTLSLEITGVDTQQILENLGEIDNHGSRLRILRGLLLRELDMGGDTDEMFRSFSWTWRGTKRSVEVLFANVRELPDSSLKASQGSWKVIIDYPIDEGGHGPQDDFARLDDYRQAKGATNTVAWVPAFFSTRTLSEVGKLVRLDYVLRGERLEQYASHLSVTDRAQARVLLANQKSQVENRVLSALQMSYGTGMREPGVLDEATHEVSECFQSLASTFRPQRPNAARLAGALEGLANQMLEHQFPAHAELGVEVTLHKLRKVLAEIERAVQEPNGRITVAKELRPLMAGIAQPLRLGEMHEEPFLLGRHWVNHFDRKAADENGDITMEAIRRWTDDPTPMGLLPEVQHLLAMVYAMQTNRSFQRHGGRIQPDLASIPDDAVLVTTELPTEEEWASARERAAGLLGHTASPLLNARNVEALGQLLRETAKGLNGATAELAKRLPGVQADFGLDPNSAARNRTAGAAVRLLSAIARCDTAVKVVHTLATFDLGGIASQALGMSAKQADALLQVFRSGALAQIRHLIGLAGRPGVDAVLSEVRVALEHDELAVALAPCLEEQGRKALAILAENAAAVAPAATTPALTAAAPTSPTAQTAPIAAAISPSRRQVLSEVAEDLGRDAALAKLDEVREALLGGKHRRLTGSWRVEESEDA